MSLYSVKAIFMAASMAASSGTGVNPVASKEFLIKHLNLNCKSSASKSAKETHILLLLIGLSIPPNPISITTLLYFLLVAQAAPVSAIQTFEL